MGQGQIPGAQWSILPSAVKSNTCNSHYQSKVFVCVSVIRGAYTDNRTDVVDQLLINA